MKIKLPKHGDYSEWDCYPETDAEVACLKDMCPEDYDPSNPWKVGDGPFSCGLKDLHNLVQKGCELKGLPEWLISK